MPTYVKAPLWNCLATEMQHGAISFLDFKQFWQRCILFMFLLKAYRVILQNDDKGSRSGITLHLHNDEWRAQLSRDK